jgi:magnesium chelatase family protein
VVLPASTRHGSPSRSISAAGCPGSNLLGLPETEVKESRDRVRAALSNAGFECPSRRITVNLAPANLPRESGRFDLPIALGVLAASGQLPGEPLGPYEFAGDLALTGELRPIRGALAMALSARRDRRRGHPGSRRCPRPGPGEASTHHRCGRHPQPADVVNL